VDHRYFALAPDIPARLWLVEFIQELSINSAFFSIGAPLFFIQDR
jgi:hypothetical protein